MNNVVPIHQTGPRTVSGKRRSSLNAMKNGLHSKTTVIRGLESESEYLQFARAIVADLNCKGAVEMAFAERLISALWREARIRRFEAGKLSEMAAEAAKKREDAADCRIVADEAAEQRTALCLIVDSSRRLDDDVYERAAFGIAMANPKDVDGYAIRDEVLEIAYRKGRYSRKQAGIIELLISRIPDDLRSQDPGRPWELVAPFFVRFTKKLREKAAKLDAEAAKMEVDSLTLGWDLDQKVADAEGRLSRQVSLARAEFEAARAMVRGDNAEQTLLPARSQRSI